MIKVVVCDGGGTLGLGRYQLPVKLQTQVRDLLSTLKSLDIKLGVASNAETAKVQGRFRARRLPAPHFVVTPEQVGKVKPSPDFVYSIQDLAGVEAQNMAYLGDDDRTDIYCAINAHVLPFAAQYSEAPTDRNYGLPIAEPKEFEEYLSTFGSQDEPYFGWSYAGTCTDTETVIDVRVLLGEHQWFTTTLKGVLKHHRDSRRGPKAVSVRWLLLNYLISQTYLSGLIQGIDWVTVYPGHEASSQNRTLAQFSEILARAFADRFVRDLILRHQDAPKSQYIPGPERDIYEQFRTIHVNPDYKSKLNGKSVLVLDDFTRNGFSLETARRMLLQAGVNRVICVAVAKYSNTFSTTRVSESWDPFAPCTLAKDEIRVVNQFGTPNQVADDYFREKIWSFFTS